MKVIVIESTDGKLTLTKSELEKMLNDAYDDGFKDGQRVSSTLTTPSWPPTMPYKIECSTADG